MSHALDQYVIVLSPVEFIMIRFPTKGRPGKRRNAIPAKAWGPSLTWLMAQHGLRQKDIYGFDPVLHPDELDPLALDPWRRDPDRKRSEAEALRDKLEAAYLGADSFAQFWLYEWTVAEGFALVRLPRDS